MTVTMTATVVIPATVAMAAVVMMRVVVVLYERFETVVWSWCSIAHRRGIGGS